MTSTVAIFTPPTIISTPKHDDLKRRLRAYSPKTEMGRVVREAFAFLPPELAGELLDQITRVVVLESSLHCVIFKEDGRVLVSPDIGHGPGVTSRKVITDAGVAYLVDAWQNTVEMETMKYHGIGTGSTAEGASQTALVTESTTALNPDSTRATGTTTEASAPVFRSVGTNTVDATTAVAEHGIFSQAATGGGVMWDRSLTGTQNLSSGDSLQTTYDCTVSSGG
jgi:hypothetical protein